MPIAGANLKWYLSGGAGNANPNASLGGARSNTLVGAGIDNLFDDVTGDEAAAGDTEYRCIYFRNEDANANGLIGPLAWIDQQTTAPGDDISIGIDPVGKNGVAVVTADENTAPAGVAFTTPLTKATGLALPGSPYAQNDFIAIWIRRTVNAGAASDPNDQASIRAEGDSF
jgi:hypothetical protein